MNATFEHRWSSLREDRTNKVWSTALRVKCLLGCRNIPFWLHPSGVDRRGIGPDDIVLITTDEESGSIAYFSHHHHMPSRAWLVHKCLPRYGGCHERAPISHYCLFCMTSTEFQSDVIPESYIVLRTVGRIPFRKSLEPKAVVGAFESRKHFAMFCSSTTTGWWLKVHTGSSLWSTESTWSNCHCRVGVRCLGRTTYNDQGANRRNWPKIGFRMCDLLFSTYWAFTIKVMQGNDFHITRKT